MQILFYLYILNRKSFNLFIKKINAIMPRKFIIKEYYQKFKRMGNRNKVNVINRDTVT